MLKWVESGALAAIFGALVWAVLQLLVAKMLAEAAEKQMSAMPRMMLTAIVIGACIGWLVPHLYRSRSRRSADIAGATVLERAA